MTGTDYIKYVYTHKNIRLEMLRPSECVFTTRGVLCWMRGKYREIPIRESNTGLPKYNDGLLFWPITTTETWIFLGDLKKKTSDWMNWVVESQLRIWRMVATFGCNSCFSIHAQMCFWNVSSFNKIL